MYMAGKRNKHKESVFVTNEYFEKSGISRQTLRHRLKRGGIVPAGSFNGANTYYQADADFLILCYWSDNYRKFLNSLELSRRELVKNNPNISYLYNNMIDDLFINDRNLRFLNPELSSFRNIIRKYYSFRSSVIIDPDDIYAKKIIEKYKLNFIRRNERFRLSGINASGFLLEDTINRFKKIEHTEIVKKYKIRAELNALNFQKIFHLFEMDIDLKDKEEQKKLQNYYERILQNRLRELAGGGKTADAREIYNELEKLDINYPGSYTGFSAIKDLYNKIKDISVSFM